MTKEPGVSAKKVPRNQSNGKTLSSSTRQARPDVSPAIQDIGVSGDALLDALRAHETEIARLHDVILSLRNDLNIWQQSQLAGDLPVFEARPSPTQDAAQTIADHAANAQIEALTTSLHAAWGELEAKQSQLQSAVDDSHALQLQAEAAKNGEKAANDKAQELQTQLEATSKRLRTALDLIARQQPTGQ